MENYQNLHFLGLEQFSFFEIGLFVKKIKK